MPKKGIIDSQRIFHKKGAVTKKDKIRFFQLKDGNFVQRKQEGCCPGPVKQNTKFEKKATPLKGATVSLES